MNQRDMSLAQLSMSDKVPKSVGLSEYEYESVNGLLL